MTFFRDNWIFSVINRPIEWLKLIEIDSNITPDHS